MPWVGRALRIWLTGYSFQDNTPPGSAVVSHSILHRKAGGAGTYNDPITVASPGSAQDMAFPPGTKFYLPSVLRYVMVEDSGASPAPAGTQGHLDMWVDGQGDSKTRLRHLHGLAHHQTDHRERDLPYPPRSDSRWLWG